MLKWHYRSRDESLIAFSNHNFYNDRLLTFPNSSQDNSKTGVSFQYLPDGVYQRSGRRNPIEASKVVDLIIEHYQNDPDLSLGVVTFSQSQKDTIQLDLDHRLRDHPELQVYFSDSVSEPGFVKNLELVQGDERDVMIFSIGYGRDETNKFILNFGPLNKEGGERRLNVAITRARYKVIMVSSIQPEDIDLSKTKSRGVKLLRSYMTMARDGLKAIYADLDVSDDADFKSPFEYSVYTVLSDRGLQLKKQVGVSGYRIDLAVIDPDQPGHFILGIECDGAMYHSGATARDRDRLRQEVLEGLGWHIHRIWSRDWINNPEHEVRKVIEAVKNAYRSPNQTKSNNRSSEKKTVETEYDGSEPITIDQIQPEAKLPEGVVYYKEKILPILGSGIEEFYQTKSNVLITAIVKIVAAEGPIHIDLVNTRLAHAWGIQRIGSKMRTTIGAAVYYGAKKGHFEKHGNFLWPWGMKTPGVRAQSETGAGRNIDHICNEEIAEGVCAILNEAISLDREELIKLTARLFGARANDHATISINQAIGILIKTNRIEWREDKLRIPRE